MIQFVPTAILTAIAVAWFEEFRIEWTPDFIFALGWLVLVLSLGAISLLNLLIRGGSAVNVASLFYLTPLSTALIAWAAKAFGVPKAQVELLHGASGRQKLLGVQFVDEAALAAAQALVAQWMAAGDAGH